MPNLREHQLRVAGVAKIICDSLQEAEVDIDMIVIACLLHDMGNIIKFKLELFPEFLKPEGLDYWKEIQEEYVRKYGKDEHVATIKISEEILSQYCHSDPPVGGEESRKDPDTSDKPQYDKERILELLHAIGFSNAKQNYETKDFGKKIAAYADMRVKPSGVTSMKERLDDGRNRFSRLQKHEPVVFEDMSNYLKKIEDQIFAMSTISPEDISAEKVRAAIPKVQSIFRTHSSDQKDS
ncbi:MAG: HD domain-containing protein [Candidatus Roizmanbacteria bacterium]|nr:HD domain-containing protein [Candidatus Roizmanbacteria bacterium]